VLCCGRAHIWAPGVANGLTFLAIVILIVLWGAVLVPMVLRAKQETSPITSVGVFRRGMQALTPRRSAQGRMILMPPRRLSTTDQRRRTMYRRRQLFNGLLFTAVATLVLSLIPEVRWMLYLHLAVDALLAGFVIFLLRVKGRDASGYTPRHSYQDEEGGEDLYLKAGEV